ncbi:MAG: SGNH/GDSL hydrolase family protein [Pseudomonadota bacterium]
MSIPYQRLVRSFALLAAVAASVILVGSCGGSDTPTRTIESVASFGDSLSDLGAYKWGNVEAAGGGRYTTNPGTIWVEEVAAHYGTSISRNRLGGAGVPTPTVFGGYGYAQGGARITQLPGVGGTPSPLGANIPVESAAMPVREQVTAHLTAIGGRVPPTQLVLILAGANDVFYQLATFNAAITPPTGNPANLPAAQAAALAAMQVAGSELATEVRRLISAGARQVVLVTLPNIADTPFGAAAGTSAQQLMTGMTATFNGALQAGLVGASGIIFVDINGFTTDAKANPAKYGFVNVTTPACTVPSSIFCTSATLVAPNADSNYLFADSVHPTAGAHRQFARYVIDRISVAAPQ